jgi:hypothetical protein
MKLETNPQSTACMLAYLHTYIIHTRTCTYTRTGGAAAAGRLAGLQGRFSIDNGRQCYMTEVHLSHNNVTNKGARSFLDTVKGERECVCACECVCLCVYAYVCV